MLRTEVHVGSEKTKLTVIVIAVCFWFALFTSACNSTSTVTTSSSYGSTVEAVSTPMVEEPSQIPALAETVSHSSEVSETITTVSTKFSELIINSNPTNALIEISGLFVGYTPYQDSWPSGSYTVTVHLPGFYPREQHVMLQDGEPVTLTVPFAFTPHIEQLLDVCVDTFWWSEDGAAVYYVECRDKVSFTSRSQFEKGPIWRLNIASGTIVEDKEAWPPTWVPKEYQSLVPDSVLPWPLTSLLSVSPSTERVLFFEEIVPESTPVPVSTIDSQEFGSSAFQPHYNVYVVLDEQTVVHLGKIQALPDNISWSKDEHIIFITSYAFSAHEEEGWIVNLSDLMMYPVSPPEQSETNHVDFFNASLVPDGDAILYRPHPNELSRIWYFEEGKKQILSNSLGPYYWIDDTRYLVFIGGLDIEQLCLCWYDLVEDVSFQILDRATLPYINDAILSPKGDSVIYTQFNDQGRQINGLWLLVLDAE